jgi:hypothetical protein
MPKPRSYTPRLPSSSAGSRVGGSRAVLSSLREKRPKDVPPEASPRAVAYVRESTEEQGQGFSPDAQREAIRTFAAENGLTLVGEYCDFHSGWKRADGRPEFQRLMSDAAERRFDCVLVYHTSRFARNQVEARRYKQMLRSDSGSRCSRSRNRSVRITAIPPRSSRNRSMRCSTSTTRSRCRSGRAPGCVRRRGRDTSSARCRGLSPRSRDCAGRA